MARLALYRKQSVVTADHSPYQRQS